jgi:CRP/FNR family transcriptional regulator
LDEDYTTLLSGVGLFALLSREQLGRIAHAIPAKSFEVDEHLSFYEQRIADMGLKKVPARLASLILQLADAEGIVIGKGRYRLSAPYTHEQFALMIGAKRVAVSRAMKGLRETGAVETGRQRIVVKDAEELGRIADEVA